MRSSRPTGRIWTSRTSRPCTGSSRGIVPTWFATWRPSAARRQAGRTHRSYYAVNTLGTVHLLEACRRVGVERFLFTSSLTVHGASPDPVDESSAFAPRHPYAASKVAAEFAVRDYSLHLGIHSIILRPTLVVGEGSKELHALGDFVLEGTPRGGDRSLRRGGPPARFRAPSGRGRGHASGRGATGQSVGMSYEVFNISQGQALGHEGARRPGDPTRGFGTAPAGPDDQPVFQPLHPDRPGTSLTRIRAQDRHRRYDPPADPAFQGDACSWTYPRMTLVITTINVPRLLEDYARNFERFGHLPDTSALIIGDRKTPHGAVADLAANLRMRRIRCPVRGPRGTGSLSSTASPG